MKKKGLSLKTARAKGMKKDTVSENTSFLQYEEGQIR